MNIELNYVRKTPIDEKHWVSITMRNRKHAITLDQIEDLEIQLTNIIQKLQQYRMQQDD